MNHTLRSKDIEHSVQSLVHSPCHCYSYSHGCYCHSAFSDRHPRRENASRLASPGICLFLDSPSVLPHDLCTCPGQQLGRGCRRRGVFCPAAAGLSSRFAAESIFTLLYSNQILLSRVCFLFLLIFVYKTRGSYQSPSRLPGLSVAHPTSLPLRAGAVPPLAGLFSRVFSARERGMFLPWMWGVLCSPGLSEP